MNSESIESTEKSTENLIPSPKIETLREAIAFFLEDDNMIDRFEAEGLKNLILQDGKITSEEKQFLQDTLEHNNFDTEALKIIKDLLVRAQGTSS